MGIVIIVLLGAWIGGSIIAVHAVEKATEKRNERLRSMCADHSLEPYARIMGHRGSPHVTEMTQQAPIGMAHPELYTMRNGEFAAMLAFFSQSMFLH